jgi:hypothetical protein
MLRDDHELQPSAPAEVHLTRIDVPFVELTAFFVKSSFALGLAFLLTSWLWVIVGTGVAGLGAGLLVLAGVPDWFAPTAPVVVAAPPPAPVAAAAPEPTPIVVLAPPVIEPPPAIPVPPPPAVPASDADRAATEAAQLAEIERMRRERASRGER